MLLLDEKEVKIAVKEHLKKLGFTDEYKISFFDENGNKISIECKAKKKKQ